MTIWLPVSLASILILQSPAAPAADAAFPFSGTWQLDATRSESTAGSDTAEPVFVDIAQTAGEVTITTRRGERRSRVVHKLVARAPSSLGVDGTTGRAHIDGDTLVTEGTLTIQGKTVATRETRRLTAGGAEMEVDVVVMVQHGYEFRGARNYGTGRDVYVRVTK